MATPSFYNENEYRAYPFIPGDVVPPKGVIVDAGFVLGPKSRFETGVHKVWLSAVRKAGAFWYFDFSSDAPELYGLNLTFSRHAADGDFAVEFIDSGTAGLSASSLSGSGDETHECDEPLWSGYLVTGRVSNLEALLDDTGAFSYAAVVEPATLQNLAEAYVVKLALANDDRSRVTPATGCGEVEENNTATFVNRNCITGDVVFKPGYNATMRQDAGDNSITIGASVGAGEGEPCDTVPLYAGESPPAGSDLLEGGLRCNQTIRSINGIGGPQLSLIAGQGVAVTVDADTHTVTVAVTMIGLATCYDTISAYSESC